MSRELRVGVVVVVLAALSALAFSASAAFSFAAAGMRPEVRLLAVAPDAGDPPPPGDLLLSRSIYAGDASTVMLGQSLPGGGHAVADGTYPGVWANEGPDPSFGVTSPIYIDRYAVSGASLSSVSTLAVPTNQIVTSFSSKSELALNLSTDGSVVTFMGYVSPENTLDVSNSNTLAHVDTTNPVKFIAPRAVAQIDASGSSSTVSVTPVNVYSGNNGRAAIYDALNNQYFMVGNAGNGSGTEPEIIVNNTGVQVVTPGDSADHTQVIGTQWNNQAFSLANKGNGFQFGYSVVQDGNPADKSGKDDNFRGMTIFNHTLYVSKGSGSNGVNTVYQVGAAQSLPTVSTAASASITILPGFSTALARPGTPGVVFNPFGLWFANPTTLYVADEGDGTMLNAGMVPNSGGVQKWVFEDDGKWHNVYTLTAGLNLGTKYPAGSLAPLDPSHYPANDGLRSLTGRVNGDGTVTLWGVTSTVSTAVDQGADQNQLVTVTDTLSFLSASDAVGETFAVLRTAAFGEVLRGVSFIPLAPPTAVAGSNQSISVGQTVHLNGTGSFAPNTPSASLGYLWSFVSAPAASTATLAGATTATPSFLADVPGTYVLQLVVSDPATGLLSAPSQVTVSSLWTPPSASAGAAQSAIVGTSVTQTGSGVDPQGLSLSYSWSLSSVPAGSTAALSGSSTSSVSFTPDLPGVYTLSLVVSDAFGSSAPSTVNITAISANDYAQGQISKAINYIASMSDAQFKAPGHRNSLTNLLEQAIVYLQAGDTANAIQSLNNALVRTDGFPVRGALDAKGPSMDWVIDSTAQNVIYSYIKNALGVLS